MRDLALEHAAAQLDDAEYLARMARLRGELEIVGARPARDLPARRATEWLDALAETWQKTELVEEKSDVIHAMYERIVIEGPRFVGLCPRPGACAAHQGTFGAPDRSRTSTYPLANQKDPDRGSR